MRRKQGEKLVIDIHPMDKVQSYRTETVFVDNEDELYINPQIKQLFSYTGSQFPLKRSGFSLKGQPLAIRLIGYLIVTFSVGTILIGLAFLLLN